MEIISCQNTIMYVYGYYNCSLSTQLIFCIYCILIQVPPEYVEIERLNPGSSPRFPISDGTTYSSMHLMGQAVLLITQLLLNGLLQINELDPLRRYTPSFERNRNKLGRYSVFQVLFLFEFQCQS